MRATAAYIVALVVALIGAAMIADAVLPHWTWLVWTVTALLTAAGAVASMWIVRHQP